MKKLLPLILLALVSNVQAQITGPVPSHFNSIQQNGVSTMAAQGDEVWVGPGLNRYIESEGEWIVPENIDSITNGIGRVFSIDMKQNRIVAGLGFYSDTPVGTIPSGYGYYTSTDAGNTWLYVPFFLDPINSGDTTFTYGGVEYLRERITVPEQSPPYAVSTSGNVILSANWASGLLRSTDFGLTWERLIIPPMQEDSLTPERDNYYWITCLSYSNSVCVEEYNIYNSVYDDNLKGFGIFTDSQNRVWFGSAGGINVSENALYAPVDSVTWHHYYANRTSSGLAGNWIINIQEDPITHKIWMTNWAAYAQNGEVYGLVSTADGGKTFEQYLIGEKINGIGFKEGYVFAAGTNGLFISPDDGETWIKSPKIKSPNTFIKESAEYLEVTTTDDRVWIGTDDGIASTPDLGKTWDIYRVDFPLSGGNIFDPEAGSVSSFAYPNPFSPTQHEFVRIKFEAKKEGSVKIRIFDLGMNLVRELDKRTVSQGTYEAIWDGYDGKGRKVANGAYIYYIETGGEKISGKILLVD